MKLLKSTQILAAALVASCISSAYAITLYESTGPYGEKRWTQTPPKDTTEYTEVEFRDNGRVAVANDMPFVETQQSNEVAALSQQVADLQARETAQRCQQLRSNLANLNIGGQIYELGDNGERNYLNEQQINDRRMRIQQAINQFCL